MDRVVEVGITSGPGVIHASKPKTKDGDESVSMAGVMGSPGAGWMEALDDGCENPYPSTSESLKTKNTRKNNDSFA